MPVSLHFVFIFSMQLAMAHQHVPKILAQGERHWNKITWDTFCSDSANRAKTEPGDSSDFACEKVDSSFEQVFQLWRVQSIGHVDTIQLSQPVSIAAWEGVDTHFSVIHSIIICWVTSSSHFLCKQAACCHFVLILRVLFWALIVCLTCVHERCCAAWHGFNLSTITCIFRSKKSRPKMCWSKAWFVTSRIRLCS